MAIKCDEHNKNTDPWSCCVMSIIKMSMYSLVRYHLMMTLSVVILYSDMRSFVKMKSLLNGEITPSITDIGESCTSHEFLASQECHVF